MCLAQAQALHCIGGAFGSCQESDRLFVQAAMLLSIDQLDLVCGQEQEILSSKTQQFWIVASSHDQAI